MSDDVSDQRGTGSKPGGDGAGGGGATGHGGAGALLGPSSSGYDSDHEGEVTTDAPTDRAWDEAGGHLTDESDGGAAGADEPP